MHKYGQIVYRAGATIEVIKYIPKNCRGSTERTGKRKKTSEEITEANMRQSARKLTRKINANFHPGDWHLTLTYKGDKPDIQEAKDKVAKFMKDMKKAYKKMGFEFKWVRVTEYMARRIHHHIVLNNVNDGKTTTADLARKFWKGNGNTYFVPLYDNGEYKKLAEYLVKETKRTREAGKEDRKLIKQAHSCSRNLIIPQPEKTYPKVKGGWKQEPKPRPGYYIDPDSLYNGTDKMGYPYQRYVMIRINVEENGWNSGVWPEDGGG